MSACCARFVIVAVSVTGCGRFGFDELTATDAPGGDPSLQLNVTFDPAIADLAKGRSVTCMGTCPVLEAGRGSLAATFDGTQCLQIPAAPELEIQMFTVAVWFRATNTGTYTMFSKPLRGTTTTENSWELWKDGSALLRFTTSGFTNTSGGAATHNAWHHVAATYAVGQVRTYLDAAAQLTTAVPVTSFATDTLLIGCDSDFGQIINPWIGQLDDIRFYDRVLSPAEIDALAK